MANKDLRRRKPYDGPQSTSIFGGESGQARSAADTPAKTPDIARVSIAALENRAGRRPYLRVPSPRLAVVALSLVTGAVGVGMLRGSLEQHPGQKIHAVGAAPTNQSHPDVTDSIPPPTPLVEPVLPKRVEHSKHSRNGRHKPHAHAKAAARHWTSHQKPETAAGSQIVRRVTSNAENEAPTTIPPRRTSPHHRPSTQTDTSEAGLPDINAEDHEGRRIITTTITTIGGGTTAAPETNQNNTGGTTPTSPAPAPSTGGTIPTP